LEEKERGRIGHPSGISCRGSLVPEKTFRGSCKTKNALRIRIREGGKRSLNSYYLLYAERRAALEALRRSFGGGERQRKQRIQTRGVKKNLETIKRVAKRTEPGGAPNSNPEEKGQKLKEGGGGVILPVMTASGSPIGCMGGGKKVNRGKGRKKTKGSKEKDDRMRKAIKQERKKDRE